MTCHGILLKVLLDFFHGQEICFTNQAPTAASIFAVPKRIDLNFDKIFIFCNGRRVWETKFFPNRIRRTSGQNFATQNGFAALFLRVPLCPFEEKTEFQGF